MRRTIVLLSVAAALAGCKANTAPTTENAAAALEADFANQAAAIDANVNAEANRAAAAAIAEANATAASWSDGADPADGTP